MRVLGRRHLPLIILATFVFCYNASGSTISGTVADSRHNGLSTVAVELLNTYHALSQHTTTDGIGRYSFDNVSDGDWFVKVMPYAYDYEEQTLSVTIYSTSISGQAAYTSEILNFTMTPRKGTLAAAQAEVVVAQEIPNEAKKAYEEGVKILRQNKMAEAIPFFDKAIKIFPNYFLANNTLGALYFEHKDYEHAAPPLVRASQVYDRSPMTLYYLGITLTKLNYAAAAIVSLNAAAVLAPSSAAIYTALGAAQRSQHQYPAAEKSLLQAKKLMRTPNAEVYKELASLYADMKQFDKGIDSLEQMLKAGNYTDVDKEKIRQQIKAWQDLLSKQPAKPTS